MPVSNTSLIERIARVLAGRDRSINAEGSSPHAAEAVDATWRDYVDDAVAILKTLREPDPAMAAAGDETMWAAMVEAALEAHSAEA